MPNYHYRAVYNTGQKTSGNLVATNESELAQQLHLAGLELIDVRRKSEKVSRRLGFKTKIAPSVLADTTSQMSDLLLAGLPFVDALTHLLHATANKPVKRALQTILRDLQHGVGISEAFSKQEAIFPSIFLSILESGETSGDLKQTFSHLRDYCSARARMSDNLRRALRYPLFLAFVAFGVISFMMVMVVPQVVLFLQTIATQLPLWTRVLIAVSFWFSHQWSLLVALIMAGPLVMAFLYRRLPKFAVTVDHVSLHLPALGPVLHKLALARFTHSLGLLQLSGGNILLNLSRARGTLNNRYLQARLDTAIDHIRHGKALSEALKGLFPSFALYVLKVGEQSGQLSKSLADIARTYDRQSTAALDQFIASLEPALTIFVGATLAWVVLAVFGPIYGNLTKLVGGG